MANKIKRASRRNKEALYGLHTVELVTGGVPVAKRADISRQVEAADIFEDDSNDLLKDKVLKPPYNLKTLAKVIESSNTIKQCVESYVVNIVMYGYRVVPIRDGVTPDPTEKEYLESFIEYANPDESLVTVMAKNITDFEDFGHYYIEVVRNAAGKLSYIRNSPAFYTRLLKKNGTLTSVTRRLRRGKEYAYVKTKKRFRRFVQCSSGSNLVVYFKQFGDPKDYDYKTGEVSTREKQVRAANKATEILHVKQRSIDPYGVPRWINQLPSILGSRQAEEVNLRYFEDNTVPPMIIAVAGGRLTRASFENLQRILQEQNLGKDRQNKALLIEAIPETSGLDDSAKSVRLEVHKLASERQSDGLFKEYIDDNSKKIRSSFRLPSSMIGVGEEANFANANTSIFVAETQVFLPERKFHDDQLNMNLINNENGFNLKTVKLESSGPEITNPEQLVKALTAANNMGGITPRKSIQLLNEAMQLSIPQYPEPGEEGYLDWMDMPFQLTLRDSKTPQTGRGEKTRDQQQMEGEDAKDEDMGGDDQRPSREE